MDEPIDFCRFFADIERNPKAPTPRLTVRQYLQARDHLSGCDTCNNRVERVLAKDSEETFPGRGTN